MLAPWYGIVVVVAVPVVVVVVAAESVMVVLAWQGLRVVPPLVVLLGPPALGMCVASRRPPPWVHYRLRYPCSWQLGGVERSRAQPRCSRPSGQHPVRLPKAEIHSRACNL